MGKETPANPVDRSLPATDIRFPLIGGDIPRASRPRIPMNRQVFAVPLALALTIGLTTDGWAQVLGTVENREGTPIPAVLVQLRADGKVLASTRSDSHGTFRFESRRAADAEEVVAERMGYHRHQRPLESGTERLTLVLERAPIPIQGVEVNAARRVCEEGSGDDRAGRLLWELIRDRYAQGLDTLGVASYTRRGETLSEEPTPQAPVLEELERRQRGSAPLLRARWEHRVGEEGYGYPVRRISSTVGPYESWVYPPLEAGFAPHFVSETFGELHHIRLVGSARGGWRVAFCPVREDRAVIEGTLTISADTTLAEAEWVFQTPEPTEAAGGWAIFDPPQEGDRPWPLPREGLFWREVPEGHHHHEYTFFEDWRIAPGDSVPFLPSREGSGEPDGPAAPPP